MKNIYVVKVLNSFLEKHIKKIKFYNKIKQFLYQYYHHHLSHIIYHTVYPIFLQSQKNNLYLEILQIILQNMKMTQLKKTKYKQAQHSIYGAHKTSKTKLWPNINMK